jgi:hypothetical protein
MLTKDLPWSDAPPADRRLREVAAALLRALGAAADRLAEQLSLPAPRPSHVPADPLLEFHAEAGAPEGALYVDGRLVGHVVGVTRL